MTQVERPPAPTQLEILANLLIGDDDEARPLPPPSGRGPRAALESVIADALARPPCVVSFSGGRDSSAILAIATHVARRDGFPLPVPATLRFPAGLASDESEWQTLVLDHLRLTERVVLRLEDELDALGEVATAELRRRGLRWPVNIHMHAPIVDAAAGGTVLTGAGGDELLGTQASRFVLLARGAVRPNRRDLRTLVGDVAPRPLRAAWWRRRHAPHHPWLTPAGRELVDRALARDAVTWPHRWDESVRLWSRSRALRSFRTALPELAHPRGVDLSSPFIDPAVLAELVVAGGPTGFSSRAAAMAVLVGDLLPDVVVDRATKGAYTGALCGPRTREFARGWRGDGVDPALVDVEAARRAWLAESPSINAVPLLQAAWLAEQTTAA